MSKSRRSPSNFASVCDTSENNDDVGSESSSATVRAAAGNEESARAVAASSKKFKHRENDNRLKEQPPADGEDEEVKFHCSQCHLTETCHYFGKNPPFVKKQVAFKEDTYVMRDPFIPREKGRANFMVIGGICDLCRQAVCVHCSTFYFKRFCDNCASLHLQEFPQEIGLKIQKKLNSKS